MSSDGTSFTVEVYEPQGYSTESEENWGIRNHEVYDTFADAEKAAKPLASVWRNVRIRKHAYSEVALYQDGVSVG